MNKIDGSKKRFLDEEQITSNKKREISPGISALISVANIMNVRYPNGLDLLSCVATESLVNVPANTTSLSGRSALSTSSGTVPLEIADKKSRLTELEKKIDDVVSKLQKISSNIKEIKRLSSQLLPQNPSTGVSSEVHILEIMSFEGCHPRPPTSPNKSKS